MLIVFNKQFFQKIIIFNICCILSITATCDSLKHCSSFLLQPDQNPNPWADRNLVVIPALA